MGESEQAPLLLRNEVKRKAAKQQEKRGVTNCEDLAFRSQA